MILKINILILATIFFSNAEELQIKLIVERNDIVNEYFMPIKDGEFRYGGIRNSFHKSNPELITRDLGLNCIGKAIKIPNSNEYFIEVNINDREIEYNKFSRTKNGEKDVTLPSVNGGVIKSEIQLTKNVVKALGGSVSTRKVSVPGQNDVEIENSKTILIVLVEIAQQGDAPEPASPAR